MPDGVLSHKILRSMGMSRQRSCLAVPSSVTQPQRGGVSHLYPHQQHGGSHLSHPTGLRALFHGVPPRAGRWAGSSHTPDWHRGRPAAANTPAWLGVPGRRLPGPSASPRRHTSSPASSGYRLQGKCPRGLKIARRSAAKAPAPAAIPAAPGDRVIFMSDSVTLGPAGRAGVSAPR